jgi:hypothetical protein
MTTPIDRVGGLTNLGYAGGHLDPHMSTPVTKVTGAENLPPMIGRLPLVITAQLLLLLLLLMLLLLLLVMMLLLLLLMLLLLMMLDIVVGCIGRRSHVWLNTLSHALQ